MPLKNTAVYNNFLLINKLQIVHENWKQQLLYSS